MERERHGFVTFWLWLMVIGNGIMAIAFFADNYIVIFADNSIIDSIIGSIQCIGLCVYAILILNWINGFWLMICFSLIPPFFQSNFFISIIFAALWCLINFGILKLKKNGVSTWDYLTGKNHQRSSNNNSSQITEERKEDTKKYVK